MNLDPFVEILLRSAFGLLFVSALAHKIFNWSEFLGVSSSYTRGVLPKSARYLIAPLVVMIEAIAVFACALAPGTFAGIAVIVVLSLYALAMGLNIMRGNALLDCGCSWGDSAQPVTWSLVVRNVGLIVVAGTLLLPEGTRMMAAVDYFGVLCALLLVVTVYMTANLLIANATDLAGYRVMSTTLTVVLLLQWVGLIALAVILYATVRQVGILHQRVGPAGALQISNAVKVGEKSPEFRLDSMGGGEVTLGAASADGRSSLVMFVALDCPVCAKLMPAIKAISKKENRWLDVVFASEGDMNKQLEYYRENELEGFPFVLSPELGMTYEVGNLPYGVVLDENGHVASQGLCNTREHIESLLEAKHSGIPTIQDFLDPDFDSKDQSGVINFEKRA